MDSNINSSDGVENSGTQTAGVEFTRVALQRIRQRLLDLTRRNRLLNYKEGAKTIVIRDELPDVIFQKLLNGESLSFSYVKEGETNQLSMIGIAGDQPAENSADADLPVIVGRTSVNTVYHDDDLQTIHSQEVLDRRLLALYRDHKTIIEETGGNDLHLVIGLLEFPERGDPDTLFRAPLILVPVHLERVGSGGHGGRIRFVLKYSDETIETNHSLAEKLRMDFGIELPELPEEVVPDNYFSQVEASIRELRDKGWRVARRMSVGLLAFAKLAMWRDLDPDTWPADKSLLSHPLILKLIGGESDESDPPGQLREEYQIDHEDESQAAPEFPLITEADVSQYSAIIDSVSRTSGLVIEGPPGTGKSQTITNLIATFMSQGKSVLFVAEKLAALKVVHKRLEDAGLSSYCMQLHGHNTNKKEVLGGLAKRMTLGAPALKDVRRKREDLKRLKRMLLAHSGKLSVTVGPRAVPLYEAIWLVEALRKRLPPNVDTLASELQQSLIDEPDLDTFLHVKTTLENLGVEWDAIPPEARQAYEGLSPHQYRESMRDAAEHCFSAMTAAAGRTAADLEQINAAALPGLLAARFLFKVGKAAENEISSIPVSVPVGFVRRTLTDGRFPELKTLLGTVETFAQAVGSIDKVFDYRGTEIADKVPHAKRIANALITQWCRGDTKLSDLSHVQSQYVQTVTAFQAIPQRAAPIVQLTGTTPRTVDDYNACAGTALELIKGHDALFLYASPNLLREAAKVLLSKALNIRSELDSQRQGLKNTFQITDTLDAGQMDRAAACIENNSGFFAIFNGEYRQAKRFVRGVLSAGTKYSKGPAVVQSLRALAAFTRKRREFNENPDYRGMFGGLFNGLYTDWGALKACIDTAAALKTQCGHDASAAILSNWEGHVAKMKATAAAIHQQLSVIKALFTAFGDRGNMHSRPLTEIQRAINDAPGELGAAVSFFAPAWCNTNVTLEALAETCDSFLATRKQEADIAANPLTTAVLADEWKGASTRLDLLRPAVLWIENTLQGTQLTPAVLLWLVTEEDGLSTSHLRELRAIATTFQDALAAHFAGLSRFGTCDYKRFIGTDDSLQNLAAMSRLRLSQLDHFALYARWAIAQKVVNEAGLQKVVDYVVAGSIAPNSCSDFYEFTLYDRLVRMVMDAEPSLRAFARAAHENLRGQFSRMDQEVLRVNALEIQAGLVNKSIPLGNGSGPVAQWTERRLIDNETKKKQRHLPIRQLMLRAGGAVRALKPCFLMSPLSVARYLDPGLPHFDVVLMDEASQIRPEDALGAVARARKVIIVGDPKQLPPTSFYERTADAEQDEEASAAQDSESILDVGLKQFPYRRLRWHYRSQHERLIQFSNASFYDKDLIIVPSPARMRRDAGVYSTFIESSSYNKGRNRGEAEVVVANIIRHYQQHPTLSLGVAAFNLAQADEIQLLLDQARRDSVQIHEIMRPADEGLEELFIKNLENVQGDERDVIFISTTYGPESPGQKVFQRFGPINSDLGWRRLNVIATRAKHRVEVFTCMRPSDILLGGAARRGVEAFRNYLEYAANQPLTEVVRPSGGAPESPFEQSVLDMVTALGYQAVPQVGVAGFFIDIGVLHPDYPGEYVLAIECDGAAYHSARSVRDRDRLRQEILESKGWTIHRIWSTSWFHTRSSEIDRLKRALQEGMKEFLRNRKPHPDQMVVTEVRHMTAAEIKREIDVTDDSLVEALNLYRERNIGEGLSDKPDCILNKNLIVVLVRRRPETNEEWLHAVPLDARLKIDHGQMQHLDGILEIVRDYAI